MILSDRNYQDRYNDPGTFVKERNNFGENILALRNNSLYLIGDGFTSKGQFPFLDRLDLSTMVKNRLYKSDIKGKKESIRDFSPDENQLFVRIESASEYPNYYFRELGADLNQITFFLNPFKSLQNIHKAVSYTHLTLPTKA